MEPLAWTMTMACSPLPGPGLPFQTSPLWPLRSILRFLFKAVLLFWTSPFPSLPFPRAAQHSAPCTMAAANDEAPAPAEGAAAPAAPTAAPRAQTSAQTTLHKEFSENAAKLRAPFTEQGTFQLVVGARARARSLSFTIRRGSYTNTRAQSEGQADGHQGRKKYIARTHTLSICLSLCVVCVCVCFSSSSQDMVTARVLSVARV